VKIKEAIKLAKRADVEYILEKILNKDKMFLHLNMDYEFDADEFLRILQMHKKGYPLEYIFNEAYFYGNKFYIKEGVLIPRDDTEPLIDVALKEIKGDNLTIAEVGVGSGVISITLAQKLNAKFIATDINPIAIDVSKYNAKLYNTNIEFYLTDVLEGIDEKIDVIISNPPYVEEEWQNEELKYEPKEAIFSKDNGTFLLKKIIKEGIAKGAKLIICEMGYNQKKYIEEFLLQNNIKKYYFYKDLANRYRGFVIKL